MAYYVSACKDNGSETETCDDSEAQFWTLYVRDDAGLSQGIIDLAFREDAEAAMAVYVERDDLKALAEGQSKLAGRNAARAQKAEAEIARRDAAAGVSFYRDGVVAAANYIDQQREAFDNEHGQCDPDTGSFEFGNLAAQEHSDTLSELAEGVRTLHDAAPPAAAGEPVALQVLGDSGKWMDCRSREFAEAQGFVEFRKLYTAAPPAVLPPEKITEIMQDSWNEFCDDTGCYPDDFEYQNEQLFFDAGRWAMLVAERISSLGAQPQKPVFLPADRTDDKSVSTFDSEKFYDAGWNSRGKADKEALDAANVPYEVKK